MSAGLKNKLLVLDTLERFITAFYQKFINEETNNGSQRCRSPNNSFLNIGLVNIERIYFHGWKTGSTRKESEQDIVTNHGSEI